MHTVSIRPAKTTDMPEIKRLIGMYPGQLMQIRLPKTQDFFVAIMNGTIIGCCALQVYSKRMAEIRSLSVTKKYQKQGIATRLIRACLKRAGQQRIYEILSVTSAVNFFTQFGFRTFQQEKYALLKVMPKRRRK